MKTIFTSLDLELNQPSCKVISIGAVLGDIHTGQILDEFQVFVKIDEPLNPDIIKLTGITEEQLATNGLSLIEAYEKLKQFHSRSDFMNPVTWGKRDTDVLREDLERIGLKMSKGFHNPDKLPVYCFGHRVFDCKQHFQELCVIEGKSLQSGLKKSMKRCSLSFIGDCHEAVSDARNTFSFYHFLLFSYIPGIITKGKR